MKDYSETMTITDEDGSKKTVEVISIEKLMESLEERSIKKAIKEDTSFDEEK